MKYVMVVDNAVDLIGTDKWPAGGQLACSRTTQRLPILFPDEFTHSVVFDQLKAVYPGLVAISAGFCELNEDGWYCEGRSESLGLGSHGGHDASCISETIFKSLDEESE